MKLLTFHDYNEYKRVQVAANKLKYHNVYAEDPELRRIASHFGARVMKARTGLCHGVRNGYRAAVRAWGYRSNENLVFACSIDELLGILRKSFTLAKTCSK